MMAIALTTTCTHTHTHTHTHTQHKTFNTSVNVWTGNVVEGCLKRLASLTKPFKYVVTANIMQRVRRGGSTLVSVKIRFTSRLT